jgi:hypothetical protein
MSARSLARSALVLPIRKRRKVLRRPNNRRRIIAAVLIALGAGIAINFASRPRLSDAERLQPLESGAGLDAWSDSAGQAALRDRRLDRLASSCPRASSERRRAVLDSFPSWADDVLGLVACHRIRPGFTTDQLRAAWGPPASIVPDLNGIRPVEQWDYGRRSVLIWDGQIKSWQ